MGSGHTIYVRTYAPHDIYIAGGSGMSDTGNRQVSLEGHLQGFSFNEWCKWSLMFVERFKFKAKRTPPLRKKHNKTKMFWFLDPDQKANSLLRKQVQVNLNLTNLSGPQKLGTTLSIHASHWFLTEKRPTKCQQVQRKTTVKPSRNNSPNSRSL